MRGWGWAFGGSGVPHRCRRAGGQEVSTALGYALHLVALLSKFLQVPLRYYPEVVGSRSRLRDDVLPHLSAYPLPSSPPSPVLATYPTGAGLALLGVL